MPRLTDKMLQQRRERAAARKKEKEGEAAKKKAAVKKRRDAASARAARASKQRSNPSPVMLRRAQRLRDQDAATRKAEDKRVADRSSKRTPAPKGPRPTGSGRRVAVAQTQWDAKKKKADAAAKRLRPSKPVPRSQEDRLAKSKKAPVKKKAPAKKATAKKQEPKAATPRKRVELHPKRDRPGHKKYKTEMAARAKEREAHHATRVRSATELKHDARRKKEKAAAAKKPRRYGKRR